MFPLDRVDRLEFAYTRLCIRRSLKACARCDLLGADSAGTSLDQPLTKDLVPPNLAPHQVPVPLTGALRMYTLE
ncbi:hypothetical protein [Halochromatium salexigens]|uniref:hypothetical protein n=1 Tax=Halochromatium salexigens TaxID=49447 RepID=UPI00191443C2|nr:hypothetical protein [Halochromatium salexigens]